MLLAPTAFSLCCLSTAVKSALSQVLLSSLAMLRHTVIIARNPLELLRCVAAPSGEYDADCCQDHFISVKRNTANNHLKSLPLLKYTPSITLNSDTEFSNSLLAHIPLPLCEPFPDSDCYIFIHFSAAMFRTQQNAFDEAVGRQPRKITTEHELT